MNFGISLLCLDALYVGGPGRNVFLLAVHQTIQLCEMVLSPMVLENFPRYLLSTAVENIDLGHLEALASVCMRVCEHVHMCVATYFAVILWVGLSVNC